VSRDAPEDHADLTAESGVGKPKITKGQARSIYLIHRF
jgi:hypothetical protein